MSLVRSFPRWINGPPNTLSRTYLGFLRLNKALLSYRQSNPSSPASFTLKLAPYQLYPDFSQDGQDKHEWYKNEKYDGSEKRMDMYSAHMGALGKAEGVEFDFGGGMIANTLNAHRILQWLQNNKSPDAALTALQSLYEQYFTQRRHPSSAETLLKACIAAGLSEEEGNKLVQDESEELMETKMAIREQTGNGVDSVPYVVFEGRKRDFTLIGTKEVAEYEKTMAQVAKECV